jgi:hypothetical protein
MENTRHGRIRIIERADGHIRYIDEILRTKNPHKFFSLPKQTNNKKVAVIQLPNREKIIVIYSKNSHKLITVLSFERYIQEHKIPNEIYRRIITTIG